MAFLDPSRATILRTEASYIQGLSAALLQTGTDKGIQPVHFIGRTMPETEKRYSQTEKSLLPLFNKAKARMPPWIGKWVMEMQSVDYEIVYEPGKDEAGPLDYLSKHPLLETRNDSTENVVRLTMNTELAVVITKIRQETFKDEVMQKLAKRITKGDWEKYKRDKDLEPYLQVKQ